MASDKIIIDREHIAEYLPQRAPFMMVDELISTDEVRTVTSLEIRPDNIFCRNGFFLEAGMIESIAQTAAVRAGYLSKMENKNPPLGYIGAITNLIVNFLPEVNKRIYSEMIIVNRIMDVALIKGIVKSDNKIAAECEMKIFEKKE
ncbi:MAG: hydroxymyristoyl-ACP dehydratase [Bacteroidia bacterium]|nr:hydroxymyristoyl-ACP dehydratase [Bacteroidia bacterium]